MGRLEQAFRTAGVSFADLSGEVESRGPGPGWWEIPDDGHYTDQGNRVLAEVIIDDLLSSGLLPKAFHGGCAGPSTARGEPEAE